MANSEGMWMKRLLGSFRELRRERARATEAEEAASYELTISARQFARRARSASNDSLAFSAALARAGETTAASRIIEDFQRDVRAQEAALIEQMNEVKLARAARREKITRLRLASVLATAVLGAGLLSFSAAGLAVGSFFADLHASDPIKAKTGVGEPLKRSVSSQKTPRSRKVVLVAGKRVEMSPAQFRRYRQLVTERAGQQEFESFLNDLLPDHEAELVSRVLAATVGSVEDSTGSVTHAVTKRVPRKVQRKVKATKVPDAPETESPPSTDNKGQQTTRSPSPEPSSSPSPSEGGSSKESEGSGSLGGKDANDLGKVEPGSLAGD